MSKEDKANLSQHLGHFQHEGSHSPMELVCLEIFLQHRIKKTLTFSHKKLSRKKNSFSYKIDKKSLSKKELNFVREYQKLTKLKTILSGQLMRWNKC